MFLLLKSDGSALYSTKDIELAFKKDKDYQADRQIIIVDVRQSLYFKQVFATLKALGFKKQMAHLAYDFVTLPEGTMSSRKGLIVTYEDLRDTMRAHLTEETKQRHADWSSKKIEKTAITLATASMSFMMLRQDPESIIIFDMREAMSVDGFTGPYILYTVARIESLLKKGKNKTEISGAWLTDACEIELVKHLAEFPEVIRHAGKSFAISAVAAWAFDTAKTFNEYYHSVKIIGDDNKDRMAARLALTLATKQTLTNAMKLLGIDVLREM